jgi:hypothetical protein
MDGGLHMENAFERSTITSKPGVEALAQQQSLLAADRGRTKPRKRWVKATLALTFWTGLGLLFSIQVCLLWPNSVTLLRAMQVLPPPSSRCRVSSIANG